MARSGAAGRVPLTRELALRAAVELADEQGIEAVSMRNLAARLGVVPMALYKHVANKDDLLGGMVDVVVASHAHQPVDGGWKDAVRGRVLAARRALLAHPWARQVIESRTTRTPTVLAYMDAVAGAFIAGGFSADLTHHVMHALGHRIWGFSPEAFDGPAPPAAPVAPVDPVAEAETMRHLARAYPHIAAITQAATDGDDGRAGQGCDEQFEFEFTLDLLLDAFERLHESGWTSGGSSRPAP
ncbi:TetR/AcrR family transcriptional regulator [Georgenia faecalis]|uniref:TetR/AcrR family transcriptional regulator n=1 Tax=Georgenia faecalis TaxID=2483799 RepID=UPI000FD6DED2|nr:TetR family transcriptional regulator [Georgenia faecalis]